LLNEIWYVEVDECYMTVCRVSGDPIKDQKSWSRLGRSEIRENDRLKGYLLRLRQHARNEKTKDEL